MPALPLQRGQRQSGPPVDGAYHQAYPRRAHPDAGADCPYSCGQPTTKPAKANQPYQTQKEILTPPPKPQPPFGSGACGFKVLNHQSKTFLR